MSAPSAALPGSFEQKYHQIQPACLISHAVLNGVCETKKPQPLLHLFSGFLGRQTSSKAAAAYSPAVPSGP